MTDFAALDAALDSLEETPPPQACRVSWLIRNLPETTQAKVLAAIDNPSIRYKSITGLLSSVGIEVSEGSLGRHRRRDCRCPRG